MSSVDIRARIEAWTPALPLKVKDNIVSSDYVNAKPFVPSYQKDTQICMEQLITHEYQRIWWQELRSWQKKKVEKSVVKKILPRTVIKANSSNTTSSLASNKSKGPFGKKQTK